MLALVLLVGSILSVFFGLNIEYGYNRIYFYNKNDDFRKALFGTGQLFTFCGAVIILTVLIINASWFVNRFFMFDDGLIFFYFTIFLTLTEVMTQIPMNNLRIRQKAVTYVLVSLFKFLIITSFTIFFVVYAKEGVRGVLYAKIIGGVITLSALYIITFNEYKLGFSFLQLKLMLGFSVFLIPTTLSALVFNMSNRFFLQEYQTTSDVGMYSLGAQIAAIIPFLFTEPVKKAFSPYLFELIDDPISCKRLLVDFSRIFFAGLAIIALVLSLFSREVILVMADPSYKGSHDIVFVLSISYLLLGLSNIIVFGIHITRKTWIVAAVYPIAAAANIALNIWLIPAYGRMGAAIATLVSVIAINILYFIAINRVFPVPFEYKKFLFVLASMISINYIGTLIVLPVLQSILLKLVLLAIFITSLLFLGVINKAEIRKVQNYILRKSRIG